jgi:hypothetical protein
LVALAHRPLWAQTTADSSLARTTWPGRCCSTSPTRSTSPRGRPPSLFVFNTDSLGELIQVPGEHDVFLCGEDADAKRQVAELLESFGWPAARIRDLGGISSARTRSARSPWMPGEFAYRLTFAIPASS